MITHRSSGVDTLDQLLAPGTAGQVIQSDGSTWGASGVTINELSDTTIASPSQGSAISWDGASSYQDTARAWAIGEGTATAILVENTTPATAGTQQYSPCIVFSGRGWKSNPTAESQTALVCCQCTTQSGATEPQARFTIKTVINGGTPTEVAYFGSAYSFIRSLDVLLDVRCRSLKVDGDATGTASTVGLSNVILSAGANAPTMINVPGTGAAGQLGWIKFYNGTTAVAVPFWPAA